MAPARTWALRCGCLDSMAAAGWVTARKGGPLVGARTRVGAVAQGRIDGCLAGTARRPVGPPGRVGVCGRQGPRL